MSETNEPARIKADSTRPRRIKAAGAKPAPAKPAPAKPAPAKPAPAKPAPAKSGRAKSVRPRRWTAVLAGTATAILAAAAVVAGTMAPGNGATAAVTATHEPLPVGDSLYNCVGPTQLLTGSAAGADPQFSADSSATSSKISAVVLGNPDGSLPGASVDKLAPAPSPLAVLSHASPGAAAATPAPVGGAAKVPAGVVRDVDVSAATVLRGTPVNGQAAVAAGAVVVASGDGDLMGLAAAACQAPANDLWLAGASTAVGRTAVLTLVNSSQSPATVSLELFGAGGPLKAPGGKGLLIAPGALRSVVLAGLAPDQNLLSVHVNSAGGPVSAVIQQSVLRGLTPGGVEFLQPVQAPALAQTIPGIRVQAPAAAAKISGQSGYGDAATALAVTVPGATDVVVEVKAFGQSGQVALPDGGVFTAAAGKVTELPLAGLPAGTYSLSVSSDSPVAAIARMVNFTKPGEAVDVAYAPTSARLGDSHLVTLPGGVASALVFTSPAGAAKVMLVPISGAGVPGARTTVDLKAGTTTVVDPVQLLGKDAAAVQVSATGEAVYGTQLLGVKDTAGIAVLPITGAAATSRTVNVTVGY